MSRIFSNFSTSLSVLQKNIKLFLLFIEFRSSFTIRNKKNSVELTAFAHTYTHEILNCEFSYLIDRFICIRFNRLHVMCKMTFCCEFQFIFMCAKEKIQLLMSHAKNAIRNKNLFEWLQDRMEKINFILLLTRKKFTHSICIFFSYVSYFDVDSKLVLIMFMSGTENLMFYLLSFTYSFL